MAAFQQSEGMFDRETLTVRQMEESQLQNLTSELQSSSSAIFASDNASEELSQAPMDTSYRSLESRNFVKEHVLNGPASVRGSASSLPVPAYFDEDDGNEDEEGEDLDLESYTLKIRGQVINFFADAAGALNEMIEAREALSEPKRPVSEEEPFIESSKDMELAETKIEQQVENNKKIYEQIYRQKIQEYLALIQESIRALQAEEEELLRFCSNMYKSTCE